MGNCQNCLQQEEEQMEINSNHTEDIPSLNLEQTVVPSITIDVKTWQKESYSLYDYESNQFVSSQTICVLKEGFLYSKQNRVFYKEGVYQKNNDEQLLMPIELDGEIFQILNLRFSKRIPSSEALQEDYQKAVDDGDKLLSENQTINAEFQRDSIQKMRTATNRLLFGYPITKGPKIWIVTRSIQKRSQKEGLSLQVGDVVKLGRVKMVIKQIQLEFQQLQDEELSICSQDNPDENTRQCRVCLSTAESRTNPLIDPCKCSGTTKYIHIKCLLQWLQQRTHSNCNNYCTIFIWKNLECEICKSIYPPKFEREGITFDLIEMSKPIDKPYIMMEFQQKRSQEDNGGEGNGLYIINFGTKKELKIGRNHEVEISINDISVSRTHAILKLVNNEIVIQDKGSKFGTLVLLQNNINLVSQLSGLELQVKRTLFHFNNPLNVANSQNNYETYLGRGN